MVEFIYQLFPNLRTVDEHTWYLFKVALLIWPFMMVGTYYLAKLGLWLDKVWGISVKLRLLWLFFTAGTNELDDKGHNKAVIERFNKRGAK